MLNILLKELPERRTYNQKTYDNSPRGGAGSKRFIIHKRHIHYKNSQGKFEDINTALHFDDASRTFKQSKASYHCTIPEYADDWFTFYNAFEKTNHTIKARPVCFHVKGVKIPDQRDGLGHEGILYENAFGAGADLRVFAYWGGLRKVITINKEPVDNSQDLHFNFELSLPENSKIIDSLGKPWHKKDALPFKDKAIRIGADNKYSFFRNAAIWDNAELNTPIDVELHKKNNKLYLRKTIPKELLPLVHYPLHTDHPTNYYAAAKDGSVTFTSNVAGDWDGTHDAATGTSKSVSITSMYTGVRNQAVSWHDYYYRIRRAFCPIDTSGIGSDIVTAATFYIYADGKVNQDNDGDDFVNIVKTTHDPTDLVLADYDLCGPVDNPPLGCDTSIDIGDLSTVAYSAFILNNLAWVITNGHTMIGVREGHDILDHPIANPPDGQVKTNRVNWRTSEYANTDSDPYLDVTAVPPTPNYPTDLLKKGFISAYHCFMSAYIRAKVTGHIPLKLPDGTVF